MPELKSGKEIAQGRAYGELSPDSRFGAIISEIINSIRDGNSTINNIYEKVSRISGEGEPIKVETKEVSRNIVSLLASILSDINDNNNSLIDIDKHLCDLVG